MMQSFSQNIKEKNAAPLCFLVRNVKISYKDPIQAAEEKAAKHFMRTLGRYNVPRILSVTLYKESVDARKKPDIMLVCTMLLKVSCKRAEALEAIRTDADISLFEEEAFTVPCGEKKLANRPVIVGFGPAGMFCALLLAEHGIAPVILERGDDVEARIAAVGGFYGTKILDTESNIQFGAGGAGTFSDGKLMTRIGDPICSYVIRRFVEFGADASILTKAKPHIGTDVLTTVVSRIRDYLKAHGCEFHFRTRMTDLLVRDTANGEKTVYGVRTDRGDFPCGAVILALGHSARDTYRTLYDGGMTILPKSFSVGIRIEHRQCDMNFAAYGQAAKDTAACGAADSRILLPPAEYAVSLRERNTDGGEARGVYSFCMCPGGEVMAATSESGGVVVNGMSRSGRNGVNANAALAVSVFPSDYGNTPMGAIAYQRALEQSAFRYGGGTYAAPCQTVGSFLNGESNTVSSVTPSYMNGFVCMTDLHEVLPQYVTVLLEKGIRAFDRQLPGFAASAAVMTGVETRTSAPVRILRDARMLADRCENIYPVGEGAGYAGGITSAAVDGIHAALRLLGAYRHG